MIEFVTNNMAPLMFAGMMLFMVIVLTNLYLYLANQRSQGN